MSKRMSELQFAIHRAQSKHKKHVISAEASEDESFLVQGRGNIDDKDLEVVNSDAEMDSNDSTADTNMDSDPSDAESDVFCSSSSTTDTAAGRAPDIFRPQKPESGYRLQDISSFLVYIARRHGVADTVLVKFLAIVSLVADGQKHVDDYDKKFPKTVKGLKNVAGIVNDVCCKTVYICPKKITIRKRGEAVPVEEICGYTLRDSGQESMVTFHCVLCGSDWGRDIVSKDGNHFVSSPVSWIMKTMMGKFGRHVTVPARPNAVMSDVTDGQRYIDMQLSGSDLAVIIHADGAAISKSTSKKMYLIFMQCVNVSLRLRRPVWFLQSVWVGQHLPKDREAFLVQLTKQMQVLQRGSDNYQPIVWNDAGNTEQQSSVFPFSVLADSPERTALSGQLGHSAGQGCLYCEQVGVSIGHRICYRFDDEASLKTHASIMEIADQWNNLSRPERAGMLKTHATGGFKRYSVIMHWPKFDMVSGFCLDVMHALDEGVSRYFLHLVVDRDSPLQLTESQVTQIDIRWKSITPPGHENRQIRSIKDFKSYKAHELRFALQYGLPFITKDIVPHAVYKVFCLASNIAWTCTLDEISPEHVESLREWCPRFVQLFQETFGEAEMKYSIHLMSHVWLAVTMYGPLGNVSCYGPEDQIGKIFRKILSMYNTTKHIMNTYVDLTKSALLVEEVAEGGADSDWRVSKLANRLLGRRCSIFEMKGRSGLCTMIGLPTMIATGSYLLAALRVLSKRGDRLQNDQVYIFRAAVVETGFRVRTVTHNENFCRNESKVLDATGAFVEIKYVMAVLNDTCTAVKETFVSGNRLLDVTITEGPVAGTSTVPVKHVILVRRTAEQYTVSTAKIYKQLIVLKQSADVFCVSVPSSVFRTT